MRRRHAQQIRYGILLARKYLAPTRLTGDQLALLSYRFHSGGYGLIDTRLEQQAYDREAQRIKETR